MLRQQAAGADLAHLKPPHVNLSDGILDSLVNGPLAATVTQEEDYEETIVYLKTFDAKIHEADFDEETQRAVEKAAENREIADAVEEEYS